MVLAIDIGNTNIVIGGIEGENILFVERLSTDRTKTDVEYAISLRTVMELRKITRYDLEGCIIASVVPELTSVIEQSVTKLFEGIRVLIVGPGIKTGVNILIDNPAQLGSDMIVAAAAVIGAYKAPIILIDYGTATTVSVIKDKGQFIGGMIIPGIRTSLDSLVSKTSLLQQISLEPPKNVIGKSTIECMKSGIIYGNAACTDGLIDRIEAELGERCTIIATGGLAEKIVPHCSHSIKIDGDILLKGLKIIYDKNTR